MPDRLLPIGLTGLAAVFLLNNPVFELDMRRHQLAGMLLSHLSVAAVLAGLWPRRQALAARLPRWRPRTWVTAAAVGSAAVLMALTAAAGVLAVAGVWYVGPRCLVREAASAATLPALTAAGTLAMSQVLDQDSGALRGYVGALTNRLEEPLELVTAFLVTMALVMKIDQAGGKVAPGASRSRPEQQPGSEHVGDGDEHALDQDRSR